MAWCWQTPRGFSWAKIYAIIWRDQATISQYIAIQFFVSALRHCFVSHHSKILFWKFIWTRPWGQLYGNMIYHQK